VDKVLSAGWTALLEAWVPMVVVVAAVVVLFSMRARLQAAFACSAPIARKAFVGIGVLALVLGGAMVVGCTLQGRAGKTVDPDAVSLGIWNLVTGACWLLLVFPRERPAPEPGVGAA
jgi:hypothetical protein